MRMNTTETQLLPCPFCGNPAERTQRDNEHSIIYKVACTNCYANVTDDEAAKYVDDAWNRRINLIEHDESLRKIAELAENAGFNPWDVLREINGIASSALDELRRTSDRDALLRENVALRKDAESAINGQLVSDAYMDALKEMGFDDPKFRSKLYVLAMKCYVELKDKSATPSEPEHGKGAGS